MDIIIKILKQNYQWFFSGIGVFIIGLLLYKKIMKKSQIQTVGNNSTAIQAGRNVNINKGRK